MEKSHNSKRDSRSKFASSSNGFVHPFYFFTFFFLPNNFFANFFSSAYVAYAYACALVRTSLKGLLVGIFSEVMQV